ncbi:NAD-binding protein of Kef-type K+ transporter [Anopheles sinensis]|uniref:NAD-binding protein of Kef-type K+ transporter n=1 Tax=Anopheles sinensis TaxID=74873 RepID=A0A084VEX0_ANOSI|nr:NAD-binding protein of Kef-type K+ transporter [Anopheles sinensis]
MGGKNQAIEVKRKHARDRRQDIRETGGMRRVTSAKEAKRLLATAGTTTTTTRSPASRFTVARRSVGRFRARALAVVATTSRRQNDSKWRFAGT